MTKELAKGITANGTGFEGVKWNILGQVYYPKAVCESSFAFETNSAPGQFVPVHIHPDQDEFILVQEGQLELKLDGVWTTAKAGDLVRAEPQPGRLPQLRQRLGVVRDAGPDRDGHQPASTAGAAASQRSRQSPIGSTPARTSAS